MIKKNTLLLFGMIVLILTMSLIIFDKGLLFNEPYSNGKTLIEFDVLNNSNEIKIDKIEKIIIENTGLKENEVKVESNEKKLITRFKLVDLEVIDKIINSVINEYENNLQLSAIHRIDNTKKLSGNFLVNIYPTLFLLLVILVFLIIGVIAFRFIDKILKKLLENTELTSRVRKLEEEVKKLKNDSLT